MLLFDGLSSANSSEANDFSAAGPTVPAGAARKIRDLRVAAAGPGKGQAERADVVAGQS
ncbi:hypothetical protein [Blastococcus sp. SYSU DS0973]